MAGRTTALYRDPDTGVTSYIGIESVYTVAGGKQINIPEKIEELRKKSRAHALFCPCGCGSRLILVAGDRNLREQHFRLQEKGDIPCRSVLEGNVSISSRIALKCWLDETLGNSNLQIRVPIRTVDETDRKYEFSLLCPESKTALSYSCRRENLSDEKIAALEGNRQGLSTGASWLCYYRALQMGQVSRVVPVDKLSVIITLVLAFVFLHEEFTLKSLIGCLLIGSGTLLMVL